MTYTTIFSDLDGTLLDDNYEISKKNLQAVKRAKKHGIQFILCSGRTPVSLYNIYKQMSYDGGYVVGFNGATTWETATKSVLTNVTMPKTLCREILQNIISIVNSQNKRGYISPHIPIGCNVSDLCIGVYVKADELVLQNANDKITNVLDEEVNITRTDDILRYIKSDIIKIIVFSNREQLNDIYSKINHTINKRYEMYFTNTYMLEFSPMDVNKATGITYLINHLNIPLQSVAAIGDNFNDIEMIKLASLGIATNNGVSPLKEVADYVTKNDNNNSAVAEAIDYIINLNESEIK